MFSMVKDVLWTKVKAPVSVGTTDITSDVIDMAGYECVAFIVPIVDCVQDGTITLKGYQNTASSTSSPTPTLAATGSTVTYTANDSHNDTCLILELVKPTMRYVYVVADLATQNTATGAIWAVRYNTTKGPVTQGASVAAANIAAVA